ncbi:MAG: hypothetical protein ACMUEM_03480 [Flavobacteriales bacterium AspAUS03]
MGLNPLIFPLEKDGVYKELSIFPWSVLYYKDLPPHIPLINRNLMDTTTGTDQAFDKATRI